MKHLLPHLIFLFYENDLHIISKLFSGTTFGNKIPRSKIPVFLRVALTGPRSVVIYLATFLVPLAFYLLCTFPGVAMVPSSHALWTLTRNVPLLCHPPLTTKPSQCLQIIRLFICFAYLPSSGSLRSFAFSFALFWVLNYDKQPIY